MTPPRLDASVPFDVDAFVAGQIDAGREVGNVRNTPFVVGDQTIYIQETVVDPHVVISPDDEDLSRTIITVVESIKTDVPTVRDVVSTVQALFPSGQEDVVSALGELRKGEKALFLGEYFVERQTDDGTTVPYTAVCVHKALLAQAVASMYGLETELVGLALDQLTDENEDRSPDMHEVLRVYEEGVSFIADPNKKSADGGAVYMEEAEYRERFHVVEIGYAKGGDEIKGRVIFTPNEEVQVSLGD